MTAGAGDPVAEVGCQPLSELVTRALLEAEVLAWAEQVGLQPKEVQVRQMKHKWASCSSHGRFRFNDELSTQPARFRREIIVHELLHFKLPDHEKLFRALMNVYLAEVD